MDAPQSPHLSPDGRHRWDAAAQRWVPVEPAPAGGSPASPAPATAQQQPAPASAEVTGGWGRPVALQPWRASSTIPGLRRPPQPWAAPAQPAWSAPSTSWSTSATRPAGAAATTAAPAAIGGVIATVGGIGLVIGAFLAWISASAQRVSTSQSGINTPSGDGWFFVVCGLAVAVAAIGAVVTPKAWLGLLVAAGSLAAAGLTIYEFTDVHGHIADARSAYGTDVGSYGVGLYLLAIGSLLALAGGLGEAIRGRGR